MKNISILAVSTTGLGDTVLNTPAINALGQFGQMEVLVHQRNVGLILNNPYVRKIHTYRNNALYRLWLAVQLAKNKYDHVMILHANSDILKLLPFLRYERAYNLQGWHDKAKRVESITPDPQLHYINKRLLLAKRLGIDSSDLSLKVFLDEKEMESGRQWLSSHLPPGPIIALCPGASRANRRWPSDRFAIVAKELGQGEQAAGIIVLGNAAEKGIFQEIQAACPGAVPALGLDLRLCASILAHVRLLITNDTGPMHLAQAVGTRVLGLFGPSDPFTIGPIDPMHRVIKVPATCEPCITKECPYPHCLESIKVDDVLSMAKGMLGR